VEAIEKYEEKVKKTIYFSKCHKWNKSQFFIIPHS